VKISILTSDGSPLGVSSKTVYGDNWRIGTGGAELALITLCEEWTKAGHEVVLYNDPKEPNASPFEQRPVASFNIKDPTDVLIVFRTPCRNVINSKALKVWFSCDQYTSAPFKGYNKLVDKTVCISEFHRNYFASAYGITGVEVIDLPVRLDDYEKFDGIEKEKERFIFTSVPDRGLKNAQRLWRAIVRDHPNASLVITSDYRLWDTPKRNEHYILQWLSEKNVDFKSAIPRTELIQEQLKADIHFYPSTYDELFCIAVAESQVAGAYPITSGTGSLVTTNMGKVISVDTNDPRNDRLFLTAVDELLNDPELLARKQKEVRIQAIERFSPECVLSQWDERIFK
jgi:glycosyltransferase involved in cell wall biosynthesis